MATYNGSEFLHEQLESLAAQELLPDELVVSDDSSTDDSVQILESFRTNAPFPVKIVANRRNLGHYRNFERAISLASGDIIFICDQDDYWYPAKIQSIADQFCFFDNLLLIINDMELADRDLRSTGLTELGQIRKIRGRDSYFVSGCCTALRRELLALAFPLPSISVGYDRWIHEIALALDSRLLVEESMQLYRRHESNVSNAPSSSPTGFYWKDAARVSLSAQPTSSYERRLSCLQEVHNRLKDSSNEAYETARVARAAVDEHSELAREMRALEARIRLRRLPRPNRAAHSIGLLAKGHYRYFLGWRSFARDLLR